MARSSDPIDDRALLERFQQGDTAAFEALLTKYERPVFNFILRSVRDRARAEEVFQEVFIRVVERAHSFKFEAKFSTWLYTIARNLCIDHSRKMAFRRHRSLDESDASGRTRSLAERTASADGSPERAAIGSDLQVKLAAAVEQLPDEQREVFLMRHLQQLAFKEIARVVGVSENTAKSRMRYALERLQEALADYREYAQRLG